jgi:hypothetical protein
MNYLLWLFFVVSVITAAHTKTAMRDYNRTVWKSMHQEAPLYLRPFFFWNLAGIAIWLAAQIIPQP